MNSNIVLLGLIYLLYADGYIGLTQVLLLLALLSTAAYNCDNASSTNTNNVFNN